VLGLNETIHLTSRHWSLFCVLKVGLNSFSPILNSYNKSKRDALFLKIILVKNSTNTSEKMGIQ